MAKRSIILVVVLCCLAIVTFIFRWAASNPWDHVDSGPYRVFEDQFSIDMLDVLPDEHSDSYGHVILFVKAENGAVFRPLMHRRSVILGGGGTRDDVAQVMHTLSKEKNVYGEYGWSSFPAPVGVEFAEYIILYRGPYKRGTSAGDIHEGWIAASYSLDQLTKQAPQTGDFTHTAEELVGEDWLDLFNNAQRKRYEYRAN